MKFWTFVLMLNLLIPLSMLFMGILYLTNPPLSSNWMYGYRTKRSMKNDETWEFAQRYCGKTCCRWGIGLALLVLMIMLSVLGMSKEIIETIGSIIGTVEGLIMAGALIPTERALKRRFGV